MHATIRARLESRPVATFTTDLFTPEVKSTSSALAEDSALALSQTPAPPRSLLESRLQEHRYPELTHSQAPHASRDAMRA